MELRIDQEIQDSRQKVTDWALRTVSLESEVSDMRSQMHLMDRDMREMHSRMTTFTGPVAANGREGPTADLQRSSQARFGDSSLLSRVRAMDGFPLTGMGGASNLQFHVVWGTISLSTWKFHEHFGGSNENVCGSKDSGTECGCNNRSIHGVAHVGSQPRCTRDSDFAESIGSNGYHGGTRCGRTGQ